MHDPAHSEVDHGNPKVNYLVHEWEHGSMSRREFFERALMLLGTVTAAEALLAACSPAVVPTPTSQPPAATATRPAAAPTTAPTSAPTAAPTAAATSVATAAATSAGTRPPQPTAAPVTPPAQSAIPGYVDPSAVDGSNVTWQNGSVKMLGYLAKPKTGTGPFPGVIVVHENRGLTDHHKDVARRIANLGYIALAVDYLSRAGGTDKFAAPANPTEAINALKQDEINSDTVSAVAYLKTVANIKPKFGIVGFCWGGGNALYGAISSPDIVATVIFYGRNPTNIDDVQKVNGELIGCYGETDTGINPGIPALEAATKKYSKPFEYKIYPGAAHAFFNDTGPRFNEAAAKDSWTRLVALYNRMLKS